MTTSQNFGNNAMPKLVTPEVDLTIYTSTKVGSTSLRSLALDVRGLPCLEDFPDNTLAKIPEIYRSMLPSLGYSEELYVPAETQYSVMLWRDPVERFRSFVADFAMHPYNADRYLAEWPDIMAGNIKVDHRSVSVKGVSEETDSTWWHLVPQTRIVGPVQDHTHVFNLSEYNTCFLYFVSSLTGRRLYNCHARKSIKPKPDITPVQERLIREYYAEDYANFSGLKA